MVLKPELPGFEKSRRTVLKSFASLVPLVWVASCGGGGGTDDSLAQVTTQTPPPLPETLPVAPPSAVSLGSRLIVSGHSIPDAIVQYPWAGAISDAGYTPQVSAGTGPFASAAYRWDNDPRGPDAVKGLMQASGASYDLFLGTEAHGGSYDGRASVQAHITGSNAYGYALLWHALAANTGAQTFYGNFWRDDPARRFDSAWRSAQDIEAPLWDGIIDHVNAHRARGTRPMLLVPWLQVFMAVYDAIETGAVTGVSMADFFTDNVHTSTRGQWLQMATLMAVMYRQHPNNLSNVVSLQFGGTQSISPELAAQLRPIVWATCRATSRAGLS